MVPQWRKHFRSRRHHFLLFCVFLVSLLRGPPTFQHPEGIAFSSKPSIAAASLSSSSVVDNDNDTDNNTKTILYFTTYWNKPDFQFGTGRQPFLEHNCPVHNCWAHSISNIDDDSSGRENVLIPPTLMKNFSNFDAVLFSVQAYDNFDLGDTQLRSQIDSWRRPEQRFVFFMMESQSYGVHNLLGMNGFFNWTMTFRWDSDIPRPYGWFEEISKSKDDHSSFYAYKPDPWVQYDETRFRDSLSARPKSFHDMAKKPGKVAWIVSHCETDSRREDYVYQLRKYITVDEFGGQCQNRDSPTCDQPYSVSHIDNCTRRVQDNYKFYLAFENQFCHDYVTEKFFQRMEHSVVITLGQANYSDIAPPHSSISVFNFDTAQDLAKYLHQLDQDDASYLSYFWWKDFYRVRHPRSSDGRKKNNFAQSMCRLCEKLHSGQEEPTKVYNDMYQWWRGSAECGRGLHGLRARMVRDPSLPGPRTMPRGGISTVSAFARNNHATAQWQQSSSASSSTLLEKNHSQK